MNLRCLFLVLVVLLRAWTPARAQATLQDFGYQHMRVNNALPSGHRPLLVIVADFAGDPVLAHDRNYYDQLTFDLFSSLSVNGYFLENSLGRFYWSRAGQGTIGPVPFTAQERDEIRLDDAAGISRVITKAATWSGFSFDPFDANSDGMITDDELAILIFSNDIDSPGASRSIDPSGCLRPPGSAVNVCCVVAIAFHETTTPQGGSTQYFEDVLHELSHSLGAVDLYYGPDAGACLSNGLTAMSCSRNVPLHLDPWHKMQLGWVEPRIRSLRAGGVETLPIPQLGQPDAPVILYDPQFGTSDFFMIEYRSKSVPSYAGYDTGVASEGLAIWYIKQDQNHDPVEFPNDIPKVVIHRGAPGLDRAGSVLWKSGETTPHLNWLYAPNMPSKIVVRPFNAGDSAITFEWLWEGEMWVDFNYFGPEFGTFGSPFNTVAEGVNAVPWGGTLQIKAGSSTERPSIAKRMVIQAYGGSVTIGR